MRPLSFVFIAISLASASASPTRHSLRIPIEKRSSLVKDGLVDIHALCSHAAYSEGKLLRGLATLQQNRAGAASTDDSLARRDGGAISLTAEWSQYLWYGNISVGSPAIEFRVDFDTGSADLFLPALSCDSSCGGLTRYNPNASSSAVDLHREFELTYGDGAVSGEQYADMVSIAGFVATNQTIGAASHYSTHFSQSVPDGLMGMSFGNISMFPATPVVQTLVEEGQLSAPVFAFKLAPSHSELRIGGVDPSMYTGPFTYTPVTEQGFWQINVDSINGNGNPISKDVSAVIDTGTSFILGDAGMIREFYNGLNATAIGGGFYTMPCNAMPSVSVTIEGKAFAISADTFNLGVYNSTENSCVGGIAAQGNLGDTWILGDIFLRNVYSVFDLSELRVGFADLA